MTSERTVEKVTKMAPVGVRSNGVLQFRGHLNRERWGNFEGHGFVGWGRKSRPVVVLSSRIFSAVCTRIGSRAFPRQIGEGKKKWWGLFPSRVSDESTRRVGRSWSPRPVPGPSPWIHGVPDPSRKGWKTRGAHGDVRSCRGKNPTGPEPTLGDLPGPSCGDGDCGGAY